MGSSDTPPAAKEEWSKAPVPEGSSTAKGKDDPTIRNELKALLDDKYGPSIREYVYRCVYKPSHRAHDRYFRDVSLRGDCF